MKCVRTARFSVICAKWIVFSLPTHPRYVDVSLTITPRSGMAPLEVRNLPGSPNLILERVAVAPMGRRSRVRMQDCNLDRAMKPPQSLKCPGSSSRSRMSGAVSWMRSSLSKVFGGFPMVWTRSRTQRRSPFGAAIGRSTGPRLAVDTSGIGIAGACAECPTCRGSAGDTP